MNRWNPCFSKIFLGISGKVRFKAKSWCILPSVSLRYLSRSLSRAFSLAPDAFVVSSCSCAADPQQLCLTSAHPGLPSEVARSCGGLCGLRGTTVAARTQPRAQAGRARESRHWAGEAAGVGRAETSGPSPSAAPGRWWQRRRYPHSLAGMRGATPVWAKGWEPGWALLDSAAHSGLVTPPVQGGGPGDPFLCVFEDLESWSVVTRTWGFQRPHFGGDF